MPNCYRGSKQLGEEISLGCLAVTGSGIATAPTTAPSMKVYTAAGVVVLTQLIPPHGTGQVTGLFGYRLFLGSLFSVGRHFVVYTWTISAVDGTQEDYFDIVAGGAARGQVISGKWMSQPVADYLIFQTNDGTIRKGRNPNVSD